MVARHYLQRRFSLLSCAVPAVVASFHFRAHPRGKNFVDDIRVNRVFGGL